MKNLAELQPDGNMKLIENIRRKYQLDDLKFEDIFAGPEPVFEVSQRKKCGPIKKAQGTLDGWVSGGPGKAPKPQKDAKAPKPKKQTLTRFQARFWNISGFRLASIFDNFSIISL